MAGRGLWEEKCVTPEQLDMGINNVNSQRKLAIPREPMRIKNINGDKIV